MNIYLFTPPWILKNSGSLIEYFNLNNIVAWKDSGATFHSIVYKREHLLYNLCFVWNILFSIKQIYPGTFENMKTQ